ncbi:lipopolysaccharide biosynthesis protein [Streptomyces sp. NPDC006487]|uniref:lipopolysaccharide biosynthesis protein n=1 Tax=Streptomyces sp. NPDC006487 TaxID=3364748 RepID=UPI00369CCBC3
MNAPDAAVNAPDAAVGVPDTAVGVPDADASGKRSPLGRIASTLPPGTLPVISGTVVLGAASYIHLMAAGHSLDTDGMAALSVLWTILMSVGIGLFFPVEQELTRIVAAHRVSGTGVSGVLRQIAGLTLGMLVLLAAGLAWATPILADTFFNGHTDMVGALGLAFAAMAVGNISRGVLAGLGRFGPFGRQLGIDGVLRIGLAVGFALAGVRSPMAFALILTAAPLAAALATSVPVFRGLGRGPSDRWPGLLGGLGPLVVSTLLSQVVVNAAVVSTKLLAPEDGALVAGLLNAIVLARVPLFVFGSLQASLLSGLSTAAAAGDRAGFSRLLGRTSLVVTALGLAGGVPATLFGPWLIEVLFEAEAGLGRAVFFWISSGTLFSMLAMVLGQALLVLHEHRLQLLGWVVATLVLTGATLLPGEVSTRVSLACALASLAAVVAMAAALWATFPRRAPAAPGGPRPVG